MIATLRRSRWTCCMLFVPVATNQRLAFCHSSPTRPPNPLGIRDYCEKQLPAVIFILRREMLLGLNRRIGIVSFMGWRRSRRIHPDPGRRKQNIPQSRQPAVYTMSSLNILHSDRGYSYAKISCVWRVARMGSGGLSCSPFRSRSATLSFPLSLNHRGKRVLVCRAGSAYPPISR